MDAYEIDIEQDDALQACELDIEKWHESPELFLPFASHAIDPQMTMLEDSSASSSQAGDFFDFSSREGTPEDLPMFSLERILFSEPSMDYSSISESTDKDERSGAAATVEGEGAGDFDSGEQEDLAAEEIDGHQSYGVLLQQCFLRAPGHRLQLKAIYDWFECNTAKHKSKGWHNSIRHNLSMNEAFQQDGKETEWFLTKEYHKKRVRPTTQFRRKVGGGGSAASRGRRAAAANAAAQRQASGSRGGRATARLRRDGTLSSTQSRASSRAPTSMPALGLAPRSTPALTSLSSFTPRSGSPYGSPEPLLGAAAGSADPWDEGIAHVGAFAPALSSGCSDAVGLLGEADNVSAAYFLRPSPSLLDQPDSPMTLMAEEGGLEGRGWMESSARAGNALATTLDVEEQDDGDSVRMAQHWAPAHYEGQRPTPSPPWEGLMDALASGDTDPA